MGRMALATSYLLWASSLYYVYAPADMMLSLTTVLRSKSNKDHELKPLTLWVRTNPKDYALEVSDGSEDSMTLW